MIGADSWKPWERRHFLPERLLFGDEGKSGSPRARKRRYLRSGNVIPASVQARYGINCGTRE
jgi:hypothetical protein